VVFYSSYVGLHVLLASEVPVSDPGVRKSTKPPAIQHLDYL